MWDNGCAIMEKKNFKKNLFFSNGEDPTAIKLERGGGVKALMALPLKKRTLYGYPYVHCI